MMIRSNPPGALVYVDDYEIGTTPVATDFTYYGTRKIRLVKDGYETLTVMQPVRPPWYQISPLDFVSENLVPWEVRDERAFAYQLTPQRVVPTEELRARAEQMRRGAAAPGGVSVPAGSPGGAAPWSGPPSAVPAMAAPAVSPASNAPIGGSAPAWSWTSPGAATGVPGTATPSGSAEAASGAWGAAPAPSPSAPSPWPGGATAPSTNRVPPGGVGGQMVPVLPPR